MAQNQTKLIKEIRRAIADYMNTEGCDCCRDTNRHFKNKEKLARLLKVPPYSDKSGYDFARFRTKD